jgi:hypothetical protein
VASVADGKIHALTDKSGRGVLSLPLLSLPDYQCAKRTEPSADYAFSLLAPGMGERIEVRGLFTTLKCPLLVYHEK